MRNQYTYIVKIDEPCGAELYRTNTREKAERKAQQIIESTNYKITIESWMERI